MTIAFSVGGYAVRFASSESEVHACQELRHQCFQGRAGSDADRFDALCQHLMVFSSRRLVATCRLMKLESGCQTNKSYAAQVYDLEPINDFDGRFLEIGRFCVLPELQDPNVLRICWAAITKVVDSLHISMLFGCTSFNGTDPGPYTSGFGLLAERHLAPISYRPRQYAPETVKFDRVADLDVRSAVSQLPPLLRSYLNMGAWVSDHAVVDREMGTLHVFTGLEVARFSKRRARALRAVLTTA